VCAGPCDPAIRSHATRPARSDARGRRNAAQRDGVVTPGMHSRHWCPSPGIAGAGAGATWSNWSSGEALRQRSRVLGWVRRGPRYQGGGVLRSDATNDHDAHRADTSLICAGGRTPSQPPPRPTSPTVRRSETRWQATPRFTDALAYQATVSRFAARAVRWTGGGGVWERAVLRMVGCAAHLLISS
jgi:hypothetical protein